MKRGNLLFIYLFIYSIIVVSCKKNNEPTIDYRSKYSGIYNFKIIRKSFDMINSTYQTDTVNYVGNIFYSDQIKNNEISIHYLSGKTITVVVDAQGILYSPSNGFSGEFKSDHEVYFYLSWGGNGGGGSNEVNGFKIK